MTKSRVEQYFESKSSKPIMTPNMAKSVSHQRREKLADDTNNGVFREGFVKNNVSQHESNLTYHIGSIKNAQVTSGGYGGYQTGGAGNTVLQSPEIYSPLWLNSNLSLPRDRATVNAWCRAFFALNGLVHNAISLHSTYPISKLNIKCPNKEVERFFNEMIEEIDLMNVCVQIAQEFWLLGEAFPYLEYDQNNGKWSRVLLQNPDFIVLNKTVVANEPNIQLKPDDYLKQVIFSNKPKDIEQRKYLSPYIIDAIKRGGNIPLENFNISHLARKISPYSVHGTGLPVCVFRQLMLMDQLRESKYVQASGMINPLTLVKVGGAGQDGFKPTFQNLEEWRDIFAAASQDKDFKIFTHDGVTVEKIGSGQGIYDISGDITQLIKEIFIGLQVPSVLMDGGSDTTYANGGVALDILRQRYTQFRNMLAMWLKRKVFAPISKIQGFYEYKNGEKHLIVPDVDWNHMSIFDANDHISNLITLSAGEGEAKRASLHTLYRSLGMEFDDEQRKIRKETIASVIAKKEKEALDTMSLNELRSLNDEDEIQEPENGLQNNVEENGEKPEEQHSSNSGLEMPDADIPGLNIEAPAPPQ